MRLRFTKLTLFFSLMFILPGTAPTAGESAVIRATATVENPIGFESTALTGTEKEPAIQVNFRYPNSENAVLMLHTEKGSLTDAVSIMLSDDTRRTCGLLSLSEESFQGSDSLIITIIYTEN